ncbi:MAG: dehydrogenase [Ignavibacteria bacterium RBG_16_34_14]|nr:MAG: dehydrogenase [Ignavibacteria bacterium RBG_16_34_14]
MIIKTSPDEIQNYLVDASNFTGYCDTVYLPSNENEIIEILKESNSKKQKVTIAGNGTGLSGARVPQGGIVISIEKMNKILEINPESKYAIVEPAVILREFQSKVREYNLLYPPDPTEKNCFIGGTLSTNASGEKTFKYGSTRVYVEKLDIVLADGDQLKLERGKFIAEGYELTIRTENGKEYKLQIPIINMPLTKNAAGYYCKKDMDAIDLFVGSEGTLGIITKAQLKLVPHPEKIISCIIFFDDERDALQFISDARNKSYQTRIDKSNNTIDALALEFLDENSLNFIKEDYKQIPSNAKAAVWFEQEVNKDNEEQLFDSWMKLVYKNKGDEENAWFAMNEKEKEEIQGLRHNVSLKVADYLSQNNVKKLGTDSAVPDENFMKFYYFCTEEMKKNKFNYIAYGHFGNSHLHMNMLPNNEEEYNKGEIIYRNIYRKAVELGGTVSAEHGIGKLKTEYLLNMFGEKVISKMAGIKKILDPNLILGVGNIFNEKFLKTN